MTLGGACARGGGASKLTAMRRRHIPALLLATPALGPPALAQVERPIRIIVPFAAGTSSDVQARLLGVHMAALLPQTVLV